MTMPNDIYRKVYEKELETMPVNERLRDELAAKMRLGRQKKIKVNFLSRRFSLLRVAVTSMALAALGAIFVAPSLLPEGVIGAWKNRYLVPGQIALERAGAHVATAVKSLPAKISGKTDDWTNPQIGYADSMALGLSSSVSLGLQGSTAIGLSGGSGSAGYVPNANYSAKAIGFSTGGAKDVINFRRNIENGYLPLPTDITYEGLFYDYFFDTGVREVCRELFCPSYSTAVSADPVSGKADRYLSVGLNSGLTEADFQRPKLNVVIVLDVSGSMSSPFDRYYYDSVNGPAKEGAETNKSKIAIAGEAVNALISHLKGDDRLGVVLFNEAAYLAKPLRSVEETDIEAIKGHVAEIAADGSTNMQAGLELAAAQFGEDASLDATRQSRIIFITDAMPNTGDFSDQGLLGLVRSYADKKIYTTFIGVGVDFQSELVEALTKTEGANYYAVRSPQEFQERLDEGFDYMVTPLVFDLKLNLASQGYAIEKVYGSPEADAATGELMNVRTLFPSKTEGGETRGGLVLLKLRQLSDDPDLKLRLSYKDRDGQEHTQESDISFSGAGEQYDNSGIRKGIWLARYADLLKSWAIDERVLTLEPMRPMTINEETGIVAPGVPVGFLSRWERQSVPLRVNTSYAQLFRLFRDRFAMETAAIGDETMRQELDTLDKLISTAGTK